MNLLNRILIILFCFFICLKAEANVFEHPKQLNYIFQKLPDLENVNCKFYQEKISNGVSLKSSGNFHFDKNKGVTFYTTYPIKTTTTYNSNSSKKINDIISAIINKNYKKLEKDFAFYYEEGWNLGLKPKENSPAFNYIKQIEIGGNQKMITNIEIVTVDSITTKIRFQ